MYAAQGRKLRDFIAFQNYWFKPLNFGLQMRAHRKRSRLKSPRYMLCFFCVWCGERVSQWVDSEGSLVFCGKLGNHDQIKLVHEVSVQDMTFSFLSILCFNLLTCWWSKVAIWDLILLTMTNLLSLVIIKYQYMPKGAWNIIFPVTWWAERSLHEG